MVNDKILASLKRLTKFTTRMYTNVYSKRITEKMQKYCKGGARHFRMGADRFDKWAKIQLLGYYNCKKLY